MATSEDPRLIFDVQVQGGLASRHKLLEPEHPYRGVQSEGIITAVHPSRLLTHLSLKRSHRLLQLLATNNPLPPSLLTTLIVTSLLGGLSSLLRDLS